MEVRTTQMWLGSVINCFLNLNSQCFVATVNKCTGDNPAIALLTSGQHWPQNPGKWRKQEAKMGANSFHQHTMSQVGDKN